MVFTRLVRKRDLSRKIIGLFACSAIFSKVFLWCLGCILLRFDMPATASLARQCPRFSSCSVNLCPLDDRYPNQIQHPDDKEKACPMEKGVRVRIAGTEPGRLPHGGLTTRESSAAKRFAGLTVTEKTAMADRCRANAARLKAERPDKA